MQEPTLYGLRHGETPQDADAEPGALLGPTGPTEEEEEVKPKIKNRAERRDKGGASKHARRSKNWVKDTYGKEKEKDPNENHQPNYDRWHTTKPSKTVATERRRARNKVARAQRKANR